MLMFGAIVVCLTFTLFAIASERRKRPKQEKLTYGFELVDEVEGVKFQVDLFFNGEASGTTLLRLPSAWDGQERLDKSILNLRAETAGVKISDTVQPHLKSVSHAPNQTIHLRYGVAQDWSGSRIKDGLYNRAIIQKQYFYFTGNAFLVMPDWSADKSLSVELTWKNFPANWTIANSFGTGEYKQSFTSSPENFVKSVYLGGDFRISKIGVNRQPVFIATRGELKFSDAEFNALVEKIMRVQMAFWNDKSFPYFLVVLFPTDDYNSGGESRANSFVLYASRHTESVGKFKYLLAHELFHEWNPKRLGDLASEKFYWFSEGVTDYYASLLLLRAKLITLEEYVADYNAVLKNYYTSPARNLTNNQIMIERERDYDASRQHYARGNLLAHNWNAQIKRATGGKHSLDDVMRDLFKTAARDKQFRLSDASINSATKRYLKNGVMSDIRRYIENGQTIAPRANVVKDCLKIETTEIAKFDAGFDVQTTHAVKVFSGVKEDSNAYKAGIRNGQKLVSGGMERNAEVLAEYVVEESGARKKVKFYPAGKKVVAPQFKLAEKRCQHK